VPCIKRLNLKIGYPLLQAMIVDANKEQFIFLNLVWNFLSRVTHVFFTLQDASAQIW